MSKARVRLTIVVEAASREDLESFLASVPTIRLRPVFGARPRRRRPRRRRRRPGPEDHRKRPGPRREPPGDS
jgi:hypothetical protein